MNPVTHLLATWPLANAVTGSSRRDRVIVVCAGLFPDLDGLGAPFELATRGSGTPLLWYSGFHHLLAHNFFAGLLVGGVAAACSRRVSVALLAISAFHLHLLGDLVGSRGPDGSTWPISYFWPAFPAAALDLDWQWALNAWPNVAITVLLLAFAFWFAWRHGRSPLELLSPRADAIFVATLRQRVGKDGVIVHAAKRWREP